MADKPRIYLVHYGEIGLKGRNRSRFEERLIQNIYHAARGLGGTSVRRLFGRLRVDQPDPEQSRVLEERLARTYGVAHYDPVQVYGWDLDQVRAGIRASASHGGFSSFAVRTRRINKSFPLSSLDLNRELGALVGEASGARVDLDHPERTFHVLILNREIFLYHERLPGPGGLPVGIAGRVALLLSGGIDSPVAGARLMRRGCELTFIHFHSAPFTDRASQEKAVELAALLSRHRFRTHIDLVPLGELQQRIVAGADARYRVLLYRRTMLRLAERLARESECLALATGESLGQVSSQTLHNLVLLDRTVETPTLRPLLALDKQEIVNEAKAIGTFELSTEPHSDCCSFLLPLHPATKGRLVDVEAIEADLALDDLLEETFQRTERRDVP